jgi:anti-anti-sigma factor
VEFRVEPKADSPRDFDLIGELDLASSPALLEAVMPVARDAGDLRLDLKELSFIDSSGIRAFLILAEELGKTGRLILGSPSPTVENTLRLVGIQRADNIEVGDLPGS